MTDIVSEPFPKFADRLTRTVDRWYVNARGSNVTVYDILNQYEPVVVGDNLPDPIKVAERIANTMNADPEIGRYIPV